MEDINAQGMAAEITVTRTKWHAMLLISLALSAFTHLWNPVGFPDIFYDEGIYMRRAMHLMEGFGPQEVSTFYDHPYFGQVFLAGALSMIGYPGSLESGTGRDSIALLYAVPRVLMGLLAVADTFLVFKIAEQRYGRRVAFIAAILFAVMPVTWFTRRILLDSILLPFFLSSLLFAMRAKGAQGATKTVLIVMSGVFLGVAVFTKVPAVFMAPLVGYLVYRAYGDVRAGAVGVARWITPVLLIPAIWPAMSLAANQFGYWQDGVLWQTSRSSYGITGAMFEFLLVDPAMFALGLGGLAYAAIRKDYFLLLWAGPFLVLLSVVGYVQYFHIIPILPLLFIAAAKGIDRLSGLMVARAAFVAVAAFGLASTALVVSADVSSAQLAAVSYVLENADNKTTIVASPSYSWIFIYVFNEPYAFSDYRDAIFFPISTDDVILVSDGHFRANMDASDKLIGLYENTYSVETFTGNYYSSTYPYTSMRLNQEGAWVDVRSKYQENILNTDR